MQNAVIPVVTGGRVFSVRSKSSPDQRHIVDLGKATCTCVYSQFQRGSERLCEHQQRAVEFEQEQAEVQKLMPAVTSRLRREVTGHAAPPKVEGITDDELRTIFA